ncbi:hypothetical protein HNV11_19280 [Spirosoma taeanense]|uniref:YD repeat-containing protein n=1 Tax=Spirosoma taeanense TaxID=2735870 RepID=A0A6M5YDG6_9BACT|nr:hypothetical protein [Spirosoma taeanense]QJW91366.1 hypothetical protein HNV11_19280 [Spirosoma taeanense]
MQPTTCRLTSTTDQLRETSGKLTDEMQRTFTYNGDVVTSISERSKNGEVSFQLQYTDKQAVQATSELDKIRVTYATSTTAPISATVSRNGKIQSVFSMEYGVLGQMSRIIESRQVLPANALTTQRDYTFIYDKAGNLTTERARFTLRDGLVLEQETEYTVAGKPSPYARFPARSLLTVIALSQAVETMPGRFWHINAPTAHKTYDLNANGNRGTLRESSTFTPVYDAENKLMSQEQNALLYQSSVPDPVTKKNRQAFMYACE